MRTSETEEFLRLNLTRIDGEIGQLRQQGQQLQQRLQSLATDKAKIEHLLSDDEPEQNEIEDGNDPD